MAAKPDPSTGLCHFSAYTSVCSSPFSCGQITDDPTQTVCASVCLLLIGTQIKCCERGGYIIASQITHHWIQLIFTFLYENLNCIHIMQSLSFTQRTHLSDMCIYTDGKMSLMTISDSTALMRNSEEIKNTEKSKQWDRKHDARRHYE